MASFIDMDDESVLENIFKDSLPEMANPTDFVQCLAQLSSYGINKLSQEPEKLLEMKGEILEETQDLAFHNYKTFIKTAECSREIYQDFKIIEKHVGGLLEKLPTFHSECDKFVQQAHTIAASRKMNSLTLQRHTQLLEILEVPQLMDTCVRMAYYDEALELMQHVKRWEKKFTNIPIIVDIVQDVRNSSQLMLNQLIRELRSNIQLPACLRVIGYLRRMDVFLEPELRIKFLQARNSWFQGILAGISTDDPYTHITKTIELSRIHLFDIITQYRAIFSDEDPWLSTNKDPGPNEAALFHGWVIQKVSQFITTLERDLHAGVGGRLDSILGQCMYFGLSFSRVGADFRGLLTDVFQQAALHYFQSTMEDANKRFESCMQTYNLLSSSTSTSKINYTTSSQTDQMYPPTRLLDYTPLAAYCNDTLTAFNDLRLCAPLAIVSDVTSTLQNSMQLVNQVILAFFRAEESAFDERERREFGKFCDVYMNDLVPYISRCLQILYPPTHMAQVLGPSQVIAKIGVLDEEMIRQTIRHLLPKSETETVVDLLTETRVESNQSDAVIPSDVVQSETPLQNNIQSDAAVPSDVDQSGVSEIVDEIPKISLDENLNGDNTQIELGGDNPTNNDTKGDDFIDTKLTDDNVDIDLDKML